MAFNNEIERVKEQIKVLQSKLSFLEELEKTKSPVEEAFKDWMGVYPPTNPSVDNIFDIRWRAFQKGYDAAYEEKVSQEPEEQKWDAVRESVKWCEENPDKDPLDCLKPQTPKKPAKDKVPLYKRFFKESTYGCIGLDSALETVREFLLDEAFIENEDHEYITFTLQKSLLEVPND